MSPGTLKGSLHKFNILIGNSTLKKRINRLKIGDTNNLDGERPRKQLKAAYEQHAKQEKKEKPNKALQARLQERLENGQANDPPDVQSRYGMISEQDLQPSFPLHNLLPDLVGNKITFTARLHHLRSMSAKLVFILLRQHVSTIQGVLQYRDGVVSENFVRWAGHLHTESLVQVEGTVRMAPAPVKGCSIHDMEILIGSLHIISPAENSLALDVYNMDRAEENEETHQLELAASDRVRLADRIPFLRTPAALCIFRINSSICNTFRSTLVDQGFIEIHTPKLQSGATESGAEVFQVNYFSRTAFLAQSPQLAKQMAISADFGRVFEVGPVFRAEDSNTHRHLTEYTGLDLEMVIGKSYHEMMDIVDEMFKTIFRVVYERHNSELQVIKSRFFHEDLVWLEETPRLTFKEGVELLNLSGWTDDNGDQASEFEDLGTRAEIRLGQLVKEKYKTDYYIMDKFPASARPFYTQLDPDDDQVTNSFDIFIRGQEVATGGQRINAPEALAERMADAGIDWHSMEEYMQAFRYGAPPHAGCGIGLERVLFLLLGLGDIRNASLFPRDPKSLPQKDQKQSTTLPHPDADTVLYTLERKRECLEMPSVENLIANYGDATSTSLLDDRYTIWRHDETGAAVGYAEENGYAIIMGDPVCDARQYPVVISAFLNAINEGKALKPLWILVSKEVEELLGAKLGWRTLAVVAEERVPPNNSKKIAKKERQARKADVIIHELELGQTVPEDVRQRCDRRIADWKASRTNKQAHMTEVRPWVDMAHRRYLWAEDKRGEIAALVVLHRLAPAHGYQIKFALDFPGAPNGSIETLISRSIQSAAKAGVQSMTFGASAMREVSFGYNLYGMSAKVLSWTYRAIVQQLKLVQKSEFREKFGAQEDPVYICYPVMGMGTSGARTLIKFFTDAI